MKYQTKKRDLPIDKSLFDIKVLLFTEVLLDFEVEPVDVYLSAKLPGGIVVDAETGTHEEATVVKDEFEVGQNSCPVLAVEAVGQRGHIFVETEIGSHL